MNIRKHILTVITLVILVTIFFGGYWYYSNYKHSKSLKNSKAELAVVEDKKDNSGKLLDNNAIVDSERYFDLTYYIEEDGHSQEIVLKDAVQENLDRVYPTSFIKIAEIGDSLYLRNRGPAVHGSDPIVLYNKSSKKLEKNIMRVDKHYHYFFPEYNRLINTTSNTVVAYDLQENGVQATSTLLILPKGETFDEHCEFVCGAYIRKIDKTTLEFSVYQEQQSNPSYYRNEYLRTMRLNILTGEVEPVSFYTIIDDQFNTESGMNVRKQIIFFNKKNPEILIEDLEKAITPIVEPVLGETDFGILEPGGNVYGYDKSAPLVFQVISTLTKRCLELSYIPDKNSFTELVDITNSKYDPSNSADFPFCLK